MLRRSVLGLVGAGALSLGAGLAVAAATAPPRAHAAHSIKMSESADMHLVKKSGSILKERGTASGSLPGTVSATFNTSNLARVTATVTFSTHGGTLTVTALGYPSSLSRFSGPISVKSGTGRFKHAHGSGSFSGTVNRKSWHIKVSAHGTITY